MPLPRPSRVLQRARRALRNDQLILGLLAALVGAAAAGGVVLFREGIGAVQFAFYGTADERLHRHAAMLPWGWRLLAPMLGGLVVGLFLRATLKGERAAGVADVIESAASRGTRLPLKHGARAAVASALSLGVGASVGREGPAVHLGATLGAAIAGKLRLPRALSRTMLGCGVAAAVAASFNAPIAGALFAHEVVVGHYALSAFAPVVIASVTATMISRGHFGDFPAFIVPEFHMRSALEFPAFAGLGIAGGLLAILLMRAIVATEDRFSRLPGPDWVRPGLAGLALGLIAVPFPQVLGVGYEITDDALRGLVPFWLLAALAVAKLSATALSLGGGFPGGVFSPSLAVGALMGGAYGVVTTAAFPELSSGPSAYALVGMGAVAAAVLGAPISTTLIIFELTGDYALTVAVMIATVIATVVTQQFHGRPSFFHWQLERRGGIPSTGRDVRSLRIRTIMRAAAAVDADTGLSTLREHLRRSPYGTVFITGADGRLHGVVTLADLGDLAFDTGRDGETTASAVARQGPPALQADDDLETALHVMTGSGEDHVAVVTSHDAPRFLGCVHRTDVLTAYNQALLDARAEERGERRRPDRTP